MTIHNAFAQRRVDDKGIVLRPKPIFQDTLKRDTTPQIVKKTVAIKYSKDSLNAPVNYTADDSIYYDVKKNLMYLYDKATLKYQKTNLSADLITINGKENIASAEVGKDSLGRPEGRPLFDDGSGQKLKATKLSYNFKSRKGIVFESQTEQQNMFITGNKTKFVAHDPKDTTATDIIYQKNAVLSTCNEPIPHYGLRASKMKLIPNKWVVMGPANLEIAGVPTPIWFPFAALPLKKGARSGIIFPSNYTSDFRGFGIVGIGYYKPINDHWDATILGDVFLRGSFGVSVKSNYNYLYKNRGNFNLSYTSIREEKVDIKRNKLYNVNTPTISIYWTHNNDSRSNPYNTFNGSINIVTNGANRRYNNDIKSVSNNLFNSGVNFTHRFPDNPSLSFQASMSHSQNSKTKDISMTLPELSFNIASHPLYKNKKNLGEEQWYERVNFGFNARATNTFRGKDSTFFTKKTLQDANFGFKYDANLSTNLKLLKYIDINPNASLGVLHYFKVYTPTFDQTIVYDSLKANRQAVFNALSNRYDSLYRVAQYGKVVNEYKSGIFSTIPTLSASVAATTNLFGIVRLKFGPKNKVSIRHKITPSVSYSLSNNFYQDKWYNYVQRTNNPNAKTFLDIYQRYSIFDGSAFGSPSYQDPKFRKGNGSISYSINQLFETKYRFRKDTIDRKGTLFENISLSGNYLPNADSLKFSDLSWSTNRTILKNHTTINLNGSFSYYTVQKDTLGRFTAVNTFYAAQQRKAGNPNWYLKPMRLQIINFSVNSSISVKEIRGFFDKKTTETPKPIGSNSGRNNRENAPPTGPPTLTQSVQAGANFLDLFDNFSISHNFDFAYGKRNSNNKDTLVVGNHSINLNGNLQITKHWRIGLGNIGYNFTQKAISYPDFNISRDLHCWDMTFGYQPTRGSYSFVIKVRQNPLDFLKLPFNKTSSDAFRGY